MTRKEEQYIIISISNSISMEGGKASESLHASSDTIKVMRGPRLQNGLGKHCLFSVHFENKPFCLNPFEIQQGEELAPLTSSGTFVVTIS